VIGRNTADQLRSGLVVGHLAMLEGMIERTRAELGANAPVILTGGLAPLFVGSSPLFDHYEPDLTLNGLKLIYDRVPGSDNAIAGSLSESDHAT
jgi:type III pantothenate kinase